jgi:hypothetical protein
MNQPVDYPVRATNGKRAAQVIQVESSRLVPLLVAIACLGMVLAGLATGVAFWALSRADAAEKQALIAKLRTEGFTRALIAKGIDPYPHIEGEDR